MPEQKRHAIYLVHRRSEHDYREWIIMPATDRVALNVWTRYINHEGARPVWKGTKRPPSGHLDVRQTQSAEALQSIVNTLAGHYRQNERNPGGRQWTWDAPVVVEVTDAEVLKHWNTTPYPALNRIKRVLAHRKATSSTSIDAAVQLAAIAKLLEPVS